MRHVLQLALAGVLVLAGAAGAAKAESEAFLDRDLKGWEGLIQEFWSFKDGALVGYTPKDPGFNLEGGAANRAEELVLESVKIGLSRPWSGADGAQPAEMKWHLMKLGLQNYDAYTLDADKERFQGTVKQVPAREDITLPIEEQLIVELYSR